MRIAAIDIGTNSTRLLFGTDRRAVITRLGKDVDRTGRLDDDALTRTLDVLRDYAAAIDGADVVRAVATSAARDAANRDDFLDAAEAILGVRPEVLTGEEEGRLAYLGACAWLPATDGPFLVIDIGGGSTELVTAGGAVSLDIGAVRVTEQFLHDDPPTPEQLSQAVSVARAYVEDATRDLPSARRVRTIVGVAGTITTVAAIELGGYDPAKVHYFRLTRAAVEDVFRTLATEPLADRVHNPGLQRERADVIVGGCCVLVAALRHLDAPGLLVSERDLLDGIVASVTR